MKTPAGAKTVPYAPMDALREFHNSFGVKKFVDLDAYGRANTIELRMRLIREEFREVMDELLDLVSGGGDREKLAKELADLLVVTYGTADVFDIPLQAVFNEVHRSNMSKLGADGKPVLRADGKVLKGPNYSEADIASVIYGGMAN